MQHLEPFENELKLSDTDFNTIQKISKYLLISMTLAFVSLIGFVIV